MRAMNKRAALAITLGITGALTRQAAAQYTISNSITASSYSPYQTNNTLGQNVNFTSLQITTPGTQAIEGNGGSAEALVGNMTGLNTAINPNTLTPYNVNNTSAFEFDATYGFRIIGENTQTANGGISSSVTSENASGQVIGTSQRDSSSVNTAGVLGTDAWISTTTGGTVNHATVYTVTVGVANAATLNFNSSGTFTGSSTAGTQYTYNGGTVHRHLHEHLASAGGHRRQCRWNQSPL